MLYQLVLTIFKLYELVVVVRVLLSWIPVNRSNSVVEWIYRLTEPVLAPIRNLLPTGRIGFDFSPLILLLLLSFAKRALLSLLF